MKAVIQTDISEEKLRLLKMVKALGNPIRFQIIEYLGECQTCITNDIVIRTPLAQSTVSQHLKVLREAGLIKGELDGPATCYCLDCEGINWFQEHISEWAENIQAFCPPGDFNKFSLK